MKEGESNEIQCVDLKCLNVLGNLIQIRTQDLKESWYFVLDAETTEISGMNPKGEINFCQKC